MNTKEYYRVGDFVVCLGEGDELFKIYQIGANDLYLLVTPEKHPHIHGWEMGSKLFRINKSQVKRVITYEIKSELWQAIVDEWNRRDGI